VVDDGARILRVVTPAAAAELEAALSRPAVQRLVAAGSLVATRRLAGEELEAARARTGGAPDGVVFEHPRIAPISYPCEWSAEMLHAAGRLTLDLAEALLAEGLGLKDATPYNVVFAGPRPVFVDLASLEARAPGDETWLPYAQFVRTFVLPLLVHSRLGVPLAEAFLAHRDGLEPEQVYAMASWPQRLSPAFLGSVSVPAWLGARQTRGAAASAPAGGSGDAERARFVLRSLLRRLGRALEAAAGKARPSAWSRYLDTFSYTGADFQRKEAFVRESLAQLSPATALDVGCNTGHFSALAAAQGAAVTALDADAVSVGHTWRRAREGGLRVLPLVANLARPTPALGWRYGEQASLLERLQGRFDLVLMLAVIHHLVATEGVPLADVLDLAAELTRAGGHLLVEYVPPSDPMFRTLARGRDALHAHLTPEHFEATSRARFEFARTASLDGGRRLYLLKRRG
jgi:SAM-dependent methyltransferase